MKILKRVAPMAVAVSMAFSALSMNTFAQEIAKSEDWHTIQAVVDLGGEVATPTALLAGGVHTQYPSAGGTWQYGFWNAYCRSYYTVDRNHGSTVKVGDNTVRSVDTARGRKSIAEKFALNFFSGSDSYYYRVND